MCSESLVVQWEPGSAVGVVQLEPGSTVEVQQYSGTVAEQREAGSAVQPGSAVKCRSAVGTR